MEELNGQVEVHKKNNEELPVTGFECLQGTEVVRRGHVDVGPADTDTLVGEMMQPEGPFREIVNVEEAVRDGYRVIKTICMTREDAEELLALLGGHMIVRYYDDVPDSDDMAKVKGRIVATTEKQKKLREEKSVLSYASKTIGCKKCGSQLAKEFLKNDFCPLCGNDLRNPSVLESLAQMDTQLEELHYELYALGVMNKVKNCHIVYLCSK